MNYLFENDEFIRVNGEFAVVFQPPGKFFSVRI